MSADWPRLTVAELEEQGTILVVDGNHGQYRPLPHEFGDGRYAYIRATDMDGGLVLFDAAARINDTAFKRIRKGVGAPGDVLFSHKGTVGKLALVPMDAPPYVCSPQTTLWRTLDEKTLDRRYLYCYMRSQEFIEQWFARKGETDMADYVSLTAQRELTVALPPLPEQRAIARVLGGLDDKIELNRRMNRTLEDLARGLFRSWFVDFDPVTKNGNGKAPAAPTGLFPKRLMDSPIGPIPEGWRVGTVGAEFNLTMGQSPPGSTYNEDGAGVPFYQGRTDFGFRFPTRRVYCTAPTRFAEGGDTLVSVRAPVGDINLADERCAAGRGVAAVRHKSGATSYTYAMMGALREAFDVFNGDGTLFGSIGKADFDKMQVLVPPPAVVEAFEHIAAPWDTQILTNEKQSRSLAATRDALLPQLLSGEVRLGDAREIARSV